MPGNNAGIYKVRWLPDCPSRRRLRSCRRRRPRPRPQRHPKPRRPRRRRFLSSCCPTARPRRRRRLRRHDRDSCTPTRNTCKGLPAPRTSASTKAMPDPVRQPRPARGSFRLTDEPSAGYGQCRFVHDEGGRFRPARGRLNLYEFYPKDSYFGKTCSYLLESPRGDAERCPTPLRRRRRPRTSRRCSRRARRRWTRPRRLRTRRRRRPRSCRRPRRCCRRW